MPTQIHAAGPLGERSPGLDAAIAGYLAENPGGVNEAEVEQIVADYLAANPPSGGTGYPVQKVTVTGDLTVSKSGWPTDQIVTAVFTQNATGGHTLTHDATLASGVDWSPGTLPGSETVTTWRHSTALGWVVEGCWISVAGSASADVTPPIAGTLSSSAITGSSFTLSVTGATDAGGLHAEPYRFSTDNEATWSAWQTLEHYDASGLDASTEYTCVHQVRDAALNTTTGTPISVTTSTPDPGNDPPEWTATFTMGTPTSTSVTATASAMATDDTAVTGYQVSYNDGSTWGAITPSGSVFTLTGTAGTTYSTTKLRAVDGDGATSDPLSVPSYTLAAEATDVTLTYRSSHAGVSATGVAIGTAPGGGDVRTVLVMALANAVGAGGTAATGCTIGGVTATRDYFTDHHAGGDGTGAAVAVFRAEVPTGTTADVTITGGSTGNTRMFHVWTADSAVAPVDYGSVFYPVSTTVNVDTVNGGFIIAAATGGFGATSAWSSNMTPRLTDTANHACADDPETTGSTDAVSLPIYRPTVAAASYGPAA